ncbi:MAG: hypothetical protein MUO73_03965 [Thermoplasmata archaeon]|nr:hypothetical protein [Thermoplasmata archaeon]
MRWTETNENRGLPQSNDIDYAELVLDELCREDNLFTNRLNLFLVAESLLFLSYATFLGIDDDINIIIRIMGVIGAVVTLIYSLILGRSIMYITELHGRLQTLYPNYQRLRNDRLGRGNVNTWLWLLTIVFLFAWGYLLIISL